MKKIVISALSAASLLAPMSAFACMDESMMDWQMAPGATNVGAETKLGFRVNQVLDARTRMEMKSTGSFHPMFHTGRPDRRSVQGSTRYNNQFGGKKHSSIKGYNPLIESPAEAK